MHDHPDGKRVRLTQQELVKLVGCSRKIAGGVLKMLNGDSYVIVAVKTIAILREPANSAARKIKQWHLST